MKTVVSNRLTFSPIVVFIDFETNIPMHKVMSSREEKKGISYMSGVYDGFLKNVLK